MFKKLFLLLLFPLVAIAEEQKILELGPEDAERLAKQRAVVEKYLGDDESRVKYAKPAGKLGLLRALLAKKVFHANQSYELQCMGVVLGDTFVQDMNFHWIVVQDDKGKDPAIRYKDTSIILYPLTMISKRIEKGEALDVFELYNSITAIVEEKLTAIEDKKP